MTEPNPNPNPPTETSTTEKQETKKPEVITPPVSSLPRNVNEDTLKDFTTAIKALPETFAHVVKEMWDKQPPPPSVPQQEVKTPPVEVKSPEKSAATDTGDAPSTGKTFRERNAGKPFWDWVL